MRTSHRLLKAPKRAAFVACLIAGLVAVPLSTSSAQTAGPPDAQTDATFNQSIPFSAHFEGVVEPLGPDLQHINLVVPESAVDLASFEPPVESEPEPSDVIRHLGDGTASYYGRRFHGRRTANGESFNMRELTAAHKTLPFGSLVRVTNTGNGRSVTVRINDRGPFTRGREIDLSRAAAEEIGMISRGHARVELELLQR